ncbi:MAG: DMT family transporter [Halobacteriales archaeon]|nr:DMT family transporter [Halobacteriales archaeon]
MVEPVVYGLALVPAVLWGFSPILSKRGMAGGGSSLQASLTVVTVDSALYWVALVVFVGTDPLAGLGSWSIGLFLGAGVVGTALGRLATFTGVDRVGASINSAGISTRPLFATLLALVWLGEPVGVLTGLGVVILVAGLVVLTLSKGGDLAGWRPRDLFFPLAAAATFGIGNVIRRFGLTTTDTTVLQAVALNEVGALAGLTLFAVVARRGDVLQAPRATYQYFAGSGFLTAIALLALFAALDQGRVAVVDPLAGTAPLFTTIFAALLLGDLERVTKGVVAGAGLIVLGAALITLS